MFSVASATKDYVEDMSSGDADGVRRDGLRFPHAARQLYGHELRPLPAARGMVGGWAFPGLLRCRAPADVLEMFGYGSKR